MERMRRGDVRFGSSPPPRRYGHYSLSRPAFEDHRRYAESLSEFNASFSRGNPTSSKFEWEQVLAKSRPPNHYGINAVAPETTCDGGRFSNSSLFGTTLLDGKPVVVTEEPDVARNFSPRQRGIEVSGSCGDVNWGSFDRGLQMEEDFELQKQDYFDKFAAGRDLFQDGDNLTNASVCRRTKEFGMGHQKDPSPGPGSGSHEEHLDDLLYGPGVCRGLVTTPIGHGRLGEKSTESHVDPPSLQSSYMRSNPLADLCCSEAKHGDCTSMEDQKRESNILYNMPSVGDKYANPDMVRSNTGDPIADSYDECYPGIPLKNTRMGDQGSLPLNTSSLPANGSLHPKGQEGEVTGYRNTLLKYKEDEKHQLLPAAKNHERERERLEMLPAVEYGSCLDRVDGKFKQRPPARDLHREMHERKDGVADLQWTSAYEKHIFVSKKSRCSLTKVGNAGKSSNEAGCCRIVNSNILDKPDDMGSRDINKTVVTSLRNISAISSFDNKQEASVKKRSGHSPQNIVATDSSVKKQKHFFKKLKEPTPKKHELFPAVLQNQKAVSVANKIQDVPESSDGACAQEGEFPQASIIPAKNEQPLASSLRVKNQTPCKFINRIPDDPDGPRNQDGDSSKSYSTPSKTEPPRVPPPRVENQTPRMLAKGIRDGPGGTCNEEGNSSNSNAVHAKTAPPNASPPQVENQIPGKISKTNTDGTRSQKGDALKGNTAPAKSEPPHSNILPLYLKNDIPGVLSKRSEDVPHGASQDGDVLKGSATLVKHEQPHVSSLRVKIQKPGNSTIRDSPDGPHSQEGKSWKGNDTLAKSGRDNVSPPWGKKKKDGDVLKGRATRVKHEQPHVSSLRVKTQKTGNSTIRDSSDGPHSQEGKSWKGNDTLAKSGRDNVSPLWAKKKKAGKSTKRLGNAPKEFHGEVEDFCKGKATSAKRKPLHVPPPGVKNHKFRKLNLAGSHVAAGQKEDSLKVDVAHVKTEPPENSQEFKLLIDSVFLKFAKQLNENSAQKRSFIEQGKTGGLKCNVCGSKSEEFGDMESLVLHTFTSSTVGCRSLHLGFHKALCLMMGWRSAMTFNGRWICEALPDAEASALKENFIIWPPVAIIHNSSLQHNNPDERMVVTLEMLEAALKDIGFGERTKAGRGRPGNQSIMVVKFNGTLSGLQDAERLHRFYIEMKHGRAEFQNITDGNRSTHDQSNSPAGKEENILYGYLGVAEDLDKLDFETKKRCVVRSKKEIQNIANAF